MEVCQRAGLDTSLTRIEEYVWFVKQASATGPPELTRLND